MADLIYNGQRFDELLNDLNANIAKLKGQIETFDQNYQIVKNNWSGDEFAKADAKLLEIKNTMQRALEDFEQQKRFLEVKKQEFQNNNLGL